MSIHLELLSPEPKCLPLARLSLYHGNLNRLQLMHLATLSTTSRNSSRHAPSNP